MSLFDSPGVHPVKRNVTDDVKQGYRRKSLGRVGRTPSVVTCCAKADALTAARSGSCLRLQVRPDGARYWMLRFTVTKPHGTKAESTHGLGTCPDAALLEARAKAAEARCL